MDEWPPIRCPRFDGEAIESYRLRYARVAELVTNFRRGRYAGDTAEEMEELLERLRTPALEHQF